MKNSLWLKTLCFILAPILIFIFTCNLIYIIYAVENPDYKSIVEGNNYFESEIFSDYYKSSLVTPLSRYSHYEEAVYDEDYIDNTIENINGINYVDEDYNYTKNFVYLLIDNTTNQIYTNLIPTQKTDTIDEIKSEISKNAYYWNYNGEISTNINNLSSENIPYTDYIYTALETHEYELYTSVNQDLLYKDNFVFGKMAFDLINTIGNTPVILISILSLSLLILICSYLVISLGHKKDYEGIYLNYLDKLPLGVLFVLLFLAGGIFAFVGVLGPAAINTIFSIIAVIIFCIDLYVCFAIFVSSVIKRIKAGTLFRNTITYMLLKWLKKVFIKFKNWCKKCLDLLFTNTNSTLKLGLIYFGFILGSIILVNIAAPFTLLAIGLWIYIFILLLRKTNSFYKIKDAVHDIYEGKNDVRLDETNFSGDLKQFASDVNDIAGGFSNAISESLKSERLKTELITNVSHDIKTPLTSIISYVDLLKQENIENEKAKEYIDVLDSKSQRLKRLIEDLVEASKASSGNIKLNMEKLKVAELIKQCTGEFEDKFKANGLEIISNIPQEDICINADSRYMYRVIENVFSNITKYALKNSRVYIDVEKNTDKINISIKNISKDKLNISPDELMQRFVRGDKSRFTEGSGLGLSISKSLTELQNGDFKIFIDGDLFKVNLRFNMVK